MHPSQRAPVVILSPCASRDDSTAGRSRSSTPKRTHAEAFSPSDQPYLHPASPSPQQASITSTGEPGPGARGADDPAAEVVRGGQEEKKPVRSSIACARCRRSKVRCELLALILKLLCQKPKVGFNYQKTLSRWQGWQVTISNLANVTRSSPIQFRNAYKEKLLTRPRCQ
jgi:hypothetical protein